MLHHLIKTTSRNIYIFLQKYKKQNFKTIILPVAAAVIVIQTMLEKLNNTLVILCRVKHEK